MNIIVREFNRPAAALVKGFEGIPTGVVGDCMGRCNGMVADMKPAWPGAKIVGPALTVRTFPADNLILQRIFYRRSRSSASRFFRCERYAM